MAFVAALGSILPSAESSTATPRRVASLAEQPLLQHTQPGKPAAHPTLTKSARLAFIRRAQVWTPTDVPRMDLRAGPAGAGAFQPNEIVTCTYTQVPKQGASRKFHCTLPDGDVVKVRYGQDNGEIQGSLLATRLLWALGFPADRVYPVRVRCRGCSSDPWTKDGSRKEVYEFDPAVIERNPYGHEMWDDGEKWGWKWPELNRVDPRQGGAPREQRDALRLLAVFMQHTDTKEEQQRLLCAPNGLAPNGQCSHPFLVLHDVGLTFGRANNLNKNSLGSVNITEWTKTPVWKDPADCVGHLTQSNSGTLGDPAIREAGRKFLADLLVQLTDRQVRDLFEVAGVNRRIELNESFVTASVDDWVAAFNAKRQQIVAHHCRR